jgi:hypothetical protein
VYDVSECEGCGPVAGVPPAANATGLRLAAPQPNPFRWNAKIRFQLDREQVARVAVYDVTGREVRRVAEGVFSAGPQVVVWDGRDATGAEVAAGIYFVRLTAAHQSMTRKLVRFP